MISDNRHERFREGKKNTANIYVNLQESNSVTRPKYLHAQRNYHSLCFFISLRV